VKTVIDPEHNHTRAQLQIERNGVVYVGVAAPKYFHSHPTG